MYGFPLTIYLLSGWLTRSFPGVDPFGHDFGHLWYTLLGFTGNPHLNPIHLASTLLILGGFILLSYAWTVLYQAQETGTLATSGPYAYVRHPQYVAFIVIMFGFLLQWPTLVTLVMFPILVANYTRLTHREEREVRAEFGEAWNQYAAQTPGFVPRMRARGRARHKYTTHSIRR
jgi:protein-S-isoprenylcysteine O-methyltransferase Ste14